MQKKVDEVTKAPVVAQETAEQGVAPSFSEEYAGHNGVPESSEFGAAGGTKDDISKQENDSTAATSMAESDPKTENSSSERKETWCKNDTYYRKCSGASLTLTSV